MKSALFCLPLLWTSIACAQAPQSPERLEAEYYVAAYSQHYRVPVPLVRAVVERESSWQSCVVSSKGAVGLMQLMPATAQRLGVHDRCNIDQNISGGVRHLAGLIQRFRGDFRLAMAAYYAGEDIVGRRGLAYRNPDVVAYVARIRTTYLHFAQQQSTFPKPIFQRDVR